MIVYSLAAVVLLEYNTMLRTAEVHDTSTRSLEAGPLPISQGKPWPTGMRNMIQASTPIDKAIAKTKTKERESSYNQGYYTPEYLQQHATDIFPWDNPRHTEIHSLISYHSAQAPGRMLCSQPRPDSPGAKVYKLITSCLKPQVSYFPPNAP